MNCYSLVYIARIGTTEAVRKCVCIMFIVVFYRYSDCHNHCSSDHSSSNSSSNMYSSEVDSQILQSSLS